MIDPSAAAPEQASAQPLQEYAVVVSPKDNVAVVKQTITKGERVLLEERAAEPSRELEVRGTVTPGHRFALRAIPPGEFVLQYGQPIGTARGAQGIEPGDPITLDNMSSDVPLVRELPAELSNPAPDYLAVDERGRFEGFRGLTVASARAISS